MRKKSAQKAVEDFRQDITDVREFLSEVSQGGMSKKCTSWCYEYAIIRLYKEFEDLMLNCLVASINNDTSVLSQKTGIQFPKHLTDEICEYLVIGRGYFDFRGRDGLISILKEFVPSDHYLVQKIKDARFRDSLNRLSTLRNFAAHDSAVAKRAAADAVGMTRLGSSGAWLKNQGRFETLCRDLERLANDIAAAAPR